MYCSCCRRLLETGWLRWLLLFALLLLRLLLSRFLSPRFDLLDLSILQGKISLPTITPRWVGLSIVAFGVRAQFS